MRGNSDVERAALERRRAFDHHVTALVIEAQDAFGMANSIVEWYRPSGPVDRERLAHDVVTTALDDPRTR